MTESIPETSNKLNSLIRNKKTICPDKVGINEVPKSNFTLRFTILMLYHVL